MDLIAKDDRTTPARALLGSWRRWTGIVALFAHHRPARLRVCPDDYRKLHSRLIALCETGAVSADDRRVGYYREMGDLIRPFLDPHALSKADDEILLDLLERCQGIERELSRPGQPWSRVLVLVSLGAVVLAGGVAAGFLLAGLPWDWLRPLMLWAKGIYHWALWSYHRLGTYQRLLGAVVLGVVFSVLAVRQVGGS